MMNRAHNTFLCLAALAAITTFAGVAQAQDTGCPPDALFCAELRIGPAGPAQTAPPPPPQVVTQPPAEQPPTVIVGPAQPAPPPPQVVVQQPAPPPTQVVVQQPPPNTAVVQGVQQVPPQPQVIQPLVDPRQAWIDAMGSDGINIWLSGSLTENVAMGGVGGSYRLRLIPHLALDLGAGIYGGEDFNGQDRVEVPVTADLLFFFNPYSRVQFYALVGGGVSFAHTSGDLGERDHTYIGGEGGLGLEWRLSRFFALNFDVRGFVRERVNDDGASEFSRISDSGTLQRTNTSGGGVARVGLTFYFGN